MLPFVIMAALAAPSFDGVTLGETAAQLVAERGEPIVVNNTDDGPEYVYYSPTGNSIQSVSVRRGNVVRVIVRPSPIKDHLSKGDGPVALGVHLGDDTKAVLDLGKDRFVNQTSDEHGIAGIYRGDDGLHYMFVVNGGTVVQIGAMLPPDKAKALAATDTAPVLHGGTSYDDAIIIKSGNEDVGVRSEYAYLSMRPCGANGHWLRTKQALLSHGNKPYDMLSVKCSTDEKLARDFYFDISNFFGKF